MGLDPYTIDWRPGMPLELADFHQRYPGVSRVTVTPPTLFAYVPFAQLSHRTQQLIWWTLQWAALAGTILILLRSFEAGMELRKMFLLTAVVCFVGSWFWRLHVERGQYYIFVTMLICLDLAALRNMKERAPWVGIPIGIAIALRPTSAVLAPLLWFMDERDAAKRAVLTATAIVICSALIVGVPVWKHFFETVSSAAFAEVDRNFEAAHFGPVTAVAPALLEGLDFSKELPHYSGGSTIGALFKQQWAVTLSGLVAIIATLLAMTIIRGMSRRKYVRRDAILLFLSMMPIVMDFTRPMRNTYADVDFLPVVALMLSVMPRRIFFKASACVTFLFFIGPLESKWTVHLRHLLLVLLVGAVLLYAVMRKDEQLDRPPPLEAKGVPAAKHS